MTPVLTTEAFAALGAPHLVYVRPVKAAEIIASVPSAQVQGFDLDPSRRCMRCIAPTANGWRS